MGIINPRTVARIRLEWRGIVEEDTLYNGLRMRSRRKNERIIDPLIPNLDTTWRLMVNFTIQLLYSLGEKPWCPLNRRLGELQSHFWLPGEEENLLPLPGLEARSVQPTAQSAYRLRYQGCTCIGICWGTLHQIRVLIYYTEGGPVFNVTNLTEDFGSWREKFTKI